jgi:hypothetical protein
MASYFSPVEGSFGTASMAATPREDAIVAITQEDCNDLLSWHPGTEYNESLDKIISGIPGAPSCPGGTCGGGRRKKRRIKVQKGGDKVDYLAHLLTLGIIFGGGFVAYTGWGMTEGMLVAKGILPKLCKGMTQWGLNLLWAQKGQYCSDIAKRYSLLSKAVAALFVAGGGFTLLGTNSYNAVFTRVKAILVMIGNAAARGGGGVKTGANYLWDWILGKGSVESQQVQQAGVKGGAVTQASVTQANAMQQVLVAAATDATATRGQHGVDALFQAAAATPEAAPRAPVQEMENNLAQLGDGEANIVADTKQAAENAATATAQQPAASGSFYDNWKQAFDASNQGGGRRRRKRKSKKRKAAKRKASRRRRRSRR